MKPTVFRTILPAVCALAVAAVCLFAGCGGSDPEPAAPTQAEKVTKILTASGGTWTPSVSSAGVLVDGVDVTQDLFPGFTITFQENTFTTTGTSPVWLREDTWEFKDASATVMIRGQDNREVTIEQITDTSLKLTLEWPETTNGGRQHSLKGKHEFFLTK